MRIERTFYLLFLLSLFLNCKSNRGFEKNKLKPEIIISQINSLSGSDLGNYVYHINKTNVKLSDYNSTLKTKLTESDFPYDIYILSEILIKEDNNIEFIEMELNSKISIWDTGNWGNKFWNFIKNHNLNIEQPNFYEFNDGLKKYNFENYIKSKIDSNELGKNPLLFLNDKITDYEEGTLSLFLSKYEIIQIDYIPKEQSVGLFGKRGIDGKIAIKTK